jgi:hypothetical protein
MYRKLRNLDREHGCRGQRAEGGHLRSLKLEARWFVQSQSLGRASHSAAKWVYYYYGSQLVVKAFRRSPGLAVTGTHPIKDPCENHLLYVMREGTGRALRRDGERANWDWAGKDAQDSH